jgi:hypothetical protein
MTKLGTQSEIDKLAATLELDPVALAFLVDVPPQELRSFRSSIFERLFEQDRVLFERLAIVASRLPARVSTHLALRLGPLIAARVAAEVPPATALTIIEGVPLEFFADTCEYLDPRRFRELIPRIPVGLVVATAKELVRRGRFQTMSRFVDFVSDEQTRAVVDAIEDETAVLRVAFYMGSKNRMDHLFQTLSQARIEHLIVRVEQERDELLPAFLSVLIHVSYALKRRLADLVAAQHPAVLAGYVRAAHDQGLWSDVLPVVAGMSEDAKRKVVNLRLLSERAVQESIVDAADQHELWGLVLPMVALMDDQNRQAVASIIAARDAGTLARACNAALMGEQWQTLLELAARMPDSKQRELSRIIQALLRETDPELLARLELDQLTSAARTGVS